jgi:tetratricopeptide (TPR) repeat protein
MRSADCPSRTLAGALVVLFALLCAAARANDFDEANQLYDQGNFGEARQRYERLADRGEWSANLFYNLGNAAFRSGATGTAALNFERALALEGTHAEARANLKWLRERAGARIPQPHWWDFLFPSISATHFAIAAAVAAWCAILAAALAMFGRRAWGTFSVALLVAAYAAAGAVRADRDRGLAIVTDKEAPARLAPADRAALAEPLPAGSRVRILSERGDWVYCALPGGGRGWIAAPQIERVWLKKS